MDRKTMEHRIELVAQAIHDAQPQACAWDAETAIRREHFRECARNAIKLLDEDIGILLLALIEATAETQSRLPTTERPSIVTSLGP
jgi:hypothetical protein